MTTNAILIREGRNGGYQDVLDAAEYHSARHGSKTNALVFMARESEMYAEWRESTSKAPAAKTAQPSDDRSVAPP